MIVKFSPVVPPINFGGILVSRKQQTKGLKMKFREKYPLVIDYIKEILDKLEELGLDDEIAKLKKILEDIENE